MLQPRILVGSHRTDQQTTTKLKLNHCGGISGRRCKKTSSIGSTTGVDAVKMWSNSDRLQQFSSMNDENNVRNCAGIQIRRRQTKMPKSAQILSPAINISSSIYNLATFLILAITLYSTTLCMAELSGK